MQEKLFINQIGYFPEDKKIAYAQEEIFCNNQEDFFVCDATSNDIVFTGKKSEPVKDNLCKDKIVKLDFSSFCKSGKYYVCVKDFKSFEFEIKQNVYDSLYCSALNYLTLSRCGQNKCHTTPAIIYGTNKTKTVLGGWHDAGDYGRYTVAGTKTIMDLLLSYNNFEDINKFDILKEVRFELEWLLQMQREDGAVYHKITCYNFCNFILPEEEKEELVLSPVSTAATADFAGCLCFSSTYFEKTDKEFATKLLNAALKAQNYLDTHKDELFKNPPEITTGCYGDFNVSDERYFALCSLFCKTKKIDYLLRAIKIRNKNTNFISNLKLTNMLFWNKWNENFFWGMVSGYGSEMIIDFFDSLSTTDTKNEFENQEEYIVNKSLIQNFVKELKQAFILQAKKAMQNVQKSCFSCCSKKFVWGSNGAICDITHTFMIAYKLTKDIQYKDAAKKQLDYLLGCNPLNYCYVTKNGTKSPLFPHHRPSGASKNVFAGMLVGGPATGFVDAYVKKYLKKAPPMKSYIDNVESYSTNEVAIYWNSAFVYLLSHFVRE